MSYIQTFKISGNTKAVESAIAQCQAALLDLGCSSTVVRFKRSIRVVSDYALTNNQTGEVSKPAFKLILI